jgi:hypothetical protein
MLNGLGLHGALLIAAGFVVVVLLSWVALKAGKLLSNRGKRETLMRASDRDGRSATRDVEVGELLQRIRDEITDSESRIRQHFTSEIRGLAHTLLSRGLKTIDETQRAADIESPIQLREDYSETAPGDRSNQKSDGPSTIDESPVEEICRLYQYGADALRSNFQLTQFGILNPGDFKESGSAPPSFGPTKDGSCWLIQAKGSTYVVPVPGAVFTPDQYGLGGMKNLFECRGYEKGNRYQKVALIQPAIVRPQGKSYQQIKRGIIELKEGEPDR